MMKPRYRVEMAGQSGKGRGYVNDLARFAFVFFCSIIAAMY